MNFWLTEHDDRGDKKLRNHEETEFCFYKAAVTTPRMELWPEDLQLDKKQHKK